MNRGSRADSTAWGFGSSRWGTSGWSRSSASMAMGNTRWTVGTWDRAELSG